MHRLHAADSQTATMLQRRAQRRLRRPAAAPAAAVSWPLLVATAPGAYRTMHQLEPGTVRRITAGQVVEHVWSAVKELVENALDAGAHCVDVQLEESGLGAIVVRDDGSGIPEPWLRSF